MDVTKSMFSLFLEEVGESDLELLPINHITKFDQLSNFLIKEKIVAQDCKIFKDKLIYFFYGKASFRLKKNFLPICFVFNIKKENIYNVFPFDSGAFANKRMDFFFQKYKIDDFSCELKDILKIVNCFFENNRNYYESNSLNFNQLKFKSKIAKSYNEMLNSEVTKVLDDRKNTIEIIYKKDFSLKDNELSMIILPYLDFNFDGKIMSFKKLKSKFELNYECEVQSYQYLGDNFSSCYEEIQKHITVK